MIEPVIIKYIIKIEGREWENNYFLIIVPMKCIKSAWFILILIFLEETERKRRKERV